jgi:hypothetical protein
VRRKRFALFAKNKTSGKIFGAYLIDIRKNRKICKRLIISDNATRVFELASSLQDLKGQDDLRNFIKDYIKEGEAAPENLGVYRYASGVAGILNSKKFKRDNPKAFYGEENIKAGKLVLVDTKNFEFFVRRADSKDAPRKVGLGNGKAKIIRFVDS